MAVIFSSFWTWAGTVILILAVGGVLQNIVAAAAKKPLKRKITGWAIGERRHIEIEGATEVDVLSALNTWKEGKEKEAGR